MPFLTAPMLYSVRICLSMGGIYILRSVCKSISAFFICTQRWLMLACSIMLGLAFGIFLAVPAPDHCFSLMRMTASSHMSIVGLAFSRLLPFLFAAAAVFISKPWLLMPVLFFRGFFYSWCACITVSAFGTAGWLVQPLFQFSDSCLLPLLCWFCIRRFSDTKATYYRDLGICASISALAGAFDYCIVSPFLVMLLSS